MPDFQMPSAAQMFDDLTTEELVAARDAMITADDEDYRLAPIWAVLEVRLGELDGGVAAAG